MWYALTGSKIFYIHVNYRFHVSWNICLQDRKMLAVTELPPVCWLSAKKSGHLKFDPVSLKADRFKNLLN